MAEKLDKPIGLTARPTRSQDLYDSVKRKFAEERDLRLKYRPQGLSQYTYELTGVLAKYEVDTYADAVALREPINDAVECLFIGGPGWQARRRERARMEPQMTEEHKAKQAATSPEEKIRRQEDANMEAMMKIHQRIDQVVKDKATAEALKPWYMLMCKRPCFHNDYLPTFNRPNVHLIDTKGKGITEINAKGVMFGGKQYELDVIIYATGFEVQKTGIYNQIKGAQGLELNDKYREGIRTLLGIHSQGYPNLFIMGGYQASFQFNFTDILQAQGDHIAACIDYARRNGYQSIC